MFRHLDDNALPPDLRTLQLGVLERAAALHRRRRIVVTTAVAACLLPVVLGYVAWMSVQPNRVRVLDGVPPRQPAVTSTVVGAPATVTPSSRPTQAAGAVTVLVVGTDRGVMPGDQPIVSTDTILVVRLDPAGHRRVLAIPRDLKVTNPRDGQAVRINGLLADRPALVAAATTVAGTPIDRYIEIDTDTFAALVDAIGGVRLSFSTPVRDVHSGFAAEPGCQLLDGQQLRAYVRSRFVESFSDGQWEADPTSEPGRMVRLSDLAQRVVPRVLDGDSLRLDEVVQTILPKLTVDDGLSLAEARRIVSLARQLRDVPLEWAVLPTRAVRVADAVMLEPTAADAGVQYLLGGTPVPATEALSPSPTPVRPDATVCGP